MDIIKFFVEEDNFDINKDLDLISLGFLDKCVDLVEAIRKNFEIAGFLLQGLGDHLFRNLRFKPIDIVFLNIFLMKNIKSIKSNIFNVVNYEKIYTIIRYFFSKGALITELFKTLSISGFFYSKCPEIGEIILNIAKEEMIKVGNKEELKNIENLLKIVLELEQNFLRRKSLRNR